MGIETSDWRQRPPGSFSSKGPKLTYFTRGGVLRALSARNRAVALLALLTVVGMGCAAERGPVEAVDIRASSPMNTDPRCTTDQLGVTMSGPSGTAGSSYYTIAFTNVSAQPCVLQGYSSVWLRESATGPEVGTPGGRQPGATDAVTLAGVTSAFEVVRLVNAADLPDAACPLSTVGGLAVNPPGQPTPKWLPLPTRTCSKGAQTLFVGPVEPTAGTA